MWTKAIAGMSSFTNGDPKVEETFPPDSAGQWQQSHLSSVPKLQAPLNHVKASSHLWYNTKNFPSILSIHLLYYHYSTLQILPKTNLTPFLCFTGKSSLISALHLSFTHFSFASGFKSPRTASLSRSNKNNSWLIELGWYYELVYTAGGLSADRRPHLCWVGSGLIRNLLHQHVSSFCWRNLLCHQWAKTNHLT